MRHLEAIRLGEDIDEESGLLHAAHLQANAAMLTEYYFTQPLTLAIEGNQAREVVKPTCVIAVQGEHYFVKGDNITLHNGLIMQVMEQTLIYREGNIKVRHLLKSKVQETQVVLE